MDHAEEKQTKIKLLFTVQTINKNYTNFPSWFELSNLAFYQYFVFFKLEMIKAAKTKLCIHRMEKPKDQSYFCTNTHQ